MDSCHLFNFLFGTKRATTELSKCFSSMGERTSAHRPTRSRSNRDQIPRQCPQDDQDQQQPPPPSPLKQLQMRIANFASGGYAAATRRAERKRSTSSSEADQSGTYRATLVRPVSESSSDEEVNQDDPALSAEQANCDKERRPLVGEGAEQTATNKRGESGDGAQSIAVKPLQSRPEPENDNRIETENGLVESRASIKPAKACKRVVLYDDTTEERDQHQPIVSSTEVYNIVSEFGEARAKLRRVSLVSAQPEEDVYNYSNDNEKPENEDKRARDSEATSASLPPTRATCELSRDKRSVFVQSLVQSIEMNGNFQGVTNSTNEGEERRRSSGPTSLLSNIENNLDSRNRQKPILLVKSLPPKTPPKTNKAKCLNIQLSLNKPLKIHQLFQDERFLKKFFINLEPLDRCKAAQVCRLWRNLLYGNRDYWKGLVNVIDCTQLRREHLADCIISTLQTAKLKQQQRSKPSSNKDNSNDWNQIATLQSGQLSDYEKRPPSGFQQQLGANEHDVFFDIDQEDVWRIQELCNRFTQRGSSLQTPIGKTQQPSTSILDANNNVISEQQQTTSTSKSSSIPSQISSTLSSVSLSSLLSPLSESNRIDSLKEKLYSSLDNRGFDAICLFGATDDDIEDLVNKMPAGAHKRITVGRLNNCSVSDRGLSIFLSTFNLIEELELSGCNEITNSFELKPLSNLSRLIITDCINIADGLAQKLVEIVHQLEELTIQAYHLTDAFIEYLSLNSDTSRLKRLELPNCKEITNQSLITMAKHFSQLESLSLSGSTKISDEGIEILAEQSRKLVSLDLSWCSRITDASLECIACDLGDTLTDLILDRNVHITDIGLGYLATMGKLTLLHIRWCPRISDIGLESVLAVNTLRYLSIAGLHQVTARSLLCLIEAQELHEVELTNCPAVNGDLLMFLSARLPKCNIIF